MNIDRAGVPFIAGALAPVLVLAALRRVGWALPFAGLAGFLAFFFRDPDRQVPDDETAIVSPADGRVLVAGDPEPGGAPPGQWRQISIFLSPLDVHVNRVPFGGTITRVEYVPGRFIPAYLPESARENERNEIWIEGKGQTVVARQLVGILARRIVCRVTAGDEVRTGDRFGLMKFGSRMDVFVPTTADLLVRVGDRVRGGETVIARLPGGAAPAAG
jgi:phosphatidylserine decarboxylase